MIAGSRRVAVLVDFVVEFARSDEVNRLTYPALLGVRDFLLYIFAKNTIKTNKNMKKQREIKIVCMRVCMYYLNSREKKKEEARRRENTNKIN